MKTSYSHIKEIESTFKELGIQHTSSFKVELTLNQWRRSACLNLNTKLNTFEQTFELKNKMDYIKYLIAIKTPIFNRAMIIEFNQKLRIEAAYANQFCVYDVTRFLTQGENNIYVAYICRRGCTVSCERLACGLNDCYLLSQQPYDLSKK